MNGVRCLPVAERWCVHSYYTLSPYAPDGSGRILAAGADLARGVGEVLILAPDGAILDRFGSHPVQASFFHTGFWQTWSPDARHVYYRAGTLQAPVIVRRDLASGDEIALDGDMEGAPPSGEPILSGLLGMLYAAGYADGQSYASDDAPVSFQARGAHGLFEYAFDPPRRHLRLSVADMLERHPERDRLRLADRETKRRLGDTDGLTLMLYCVRWSPRGDRCLFYFGNHNTVAARGEPRLAYVMTSDRALGEMHLAVDLSFGRPGLHWSWQPDGERLIGYGPDPQDPTRLCLAEVRWDGQDYRRLSRHASGGHPSVCPTNPELVVTDSYGAQGEVVFIHTPTDRVVARYELPRVHGELRAGRHPDVIDHHPVFDPLGRKALVNTLPGRHGVLAEIEVPC